MLKWQSSGIFAVYSLYRKKPEEMIESNVSLDLMEFVESQILPQYAHFDKAHNMEHATRVIRR